MPERIQIRLRAIALFAAPVPLLIAFIIHPYLTDEFDIPAVAAHVVADPDRWVLAHIMLMVAFAVMLIAVVALRGLLRTAGEERWSFIAVPFLVGGGTVFIAVWGMEITVAAVANVGGDVQAVIKESDRWLGPARVVGYVMWGFGWLSMALAVYRSRILGQTQTWVVLAATVVMIGGLSYPSTGGGYLFAFGVMGFTWMLGYNALATLESSRNAATPQ